MNDDKRCSRCKETKPRGEFSKNRRQKDGLARWCNECNRAHVRAAYAADPESRKAYQRSYYRQNADNVQASNKAWKEKNRGQDRAYHLAYSKAWARRYPEQHRARVAVYYALRTGKIQKKEECDICRASPTEAHHYLGYSKEHYLDVQWLCRRHHRAQSLQRPPHGTGNRSDTSE